MKRGELWTALGVVASLIGIITFLTGKQSVKEFFADLPSSAQIKRPVQQPPSALKSATNNSRSTITPPRGVETDPKAEVPDDSSNPGLVAEEQQAHLVPFRVLPKDTSVYLDSKFIGTAEKLTEGIWITTGWHRVTLIRPGYESLDFNALFDQAGIGVQVNLSEASRPRTTQGAVVQTAGQSFETESYRATITDIRRQGTAIRLSILFENLTERSIGVAWLRTYLLDDDGNRWSLEGRDSAGFVQEFGFFGQGGVNIPAGTRLRSDFLFSSTGGSSTGQYDLISTEGSPKGRRPIVIHDLRLE